MKEFDRVDLGGARTAGEADFYLKTHRHLPCRRAVGRGWYDVLRDFFRRSTLQKEGLR